MLPSGWLADVEAGELARLADDRVVLELGAWKGRSTALLSWAARYVVSVDRHRGGGEVGAEDSLPDYLDSVRMLGNVAMVVASFEEFVPLLGRSFDLAFVDGDHDEASVRRDALLARDHVRKGGVVAFHDWDRESVRQGARAVFLDRELLDIVHTLASFQVAP